MVNEKLLKQLAQQLEQDKQRLEAKIKTLGDTDFGDSPGEDNEEADESEEMANEFSTIEALGERLTNIRRALQRIGEGDYGICEICHGDIEEILLEVAPESNLCRTCKNTV